MGVFLKTLKDIVDAAEAAHAAGTPLVQNWIQAFASFRLLGRAIDLDGVLITDFGSVFPDDFADLDPDLQGRVIGQRAYDIARREVARVLASAGFLDDTWETLRVLMRNAQLRDLERPLGPLRTAASRAKIAVADVTPTWVWGLDAALGVGTGRMQLRKAVVTFDTLFQNPAIVASGLLPPHPIGDPPKYDSTGRAHREIPAGLADVAHACRSFQSVWQAIGASDHSFLPDDPKPEDLLIPEVWSRIRTLPHEGISDPSWTLYMQRVRKALVVHASVLPVDPDRVPAWLEEVSATDEERTALRGLWTKILAAETPTFRNMGASDLLDLNIWRTIWKGTQIFKPLTERTYEMQARRALRATRESW